MEIVDNFLPEQEFNDIKNIVDSGDFPWFFGDHVSENSDTSDFYFTHTLYREYKVNSNSYGMILPILNIIKPKALIRSRALLYIGRDKLIEHGRHVDYRFPHKVFIFYLNTNNGFTRLQDDQCVSSVENRALFFDGTVEHNSTNCTDQKTRKLITINYF